jgi:hypothetical protein
MSISAAMSSSIPAQDLQHHFSPVGEAGGVYLSDRSCSQWLFINPPKQRRQPSAKFVVETFLNGWPWDAADNQLAGDAVRPRIPGHKIRSSTEHLTEFDERPTEFFERFPKTDFERSRQRLFVAGAPAAVPVPTR